MLPLILAVSIVYEQPSYTSIQRTSNLFNTLLPLQTLPLFLAYSTMSHTLKVKVYQVWYNYKHW